MSEELNTELKEMKPLIFETMLKIISGQIPVNSIEFKLNTVLPKTDAEKELSSLKAKVEEFRKRIQSNIDYAINSRCFETLMQDYNQIFNSSEGEG